MLMTGVFAMRSRKLIQAGNPVGPGSVGVSAARAKSYLAKKKSGFALSKTATRRIALSFDEFHQVLEFQDGLGINQIERRVIERDSPIGLRPFCDYELF
jgi:hypothetical protein